MPGLAAGGGLLRSAGAPRPQNSFNKGAEFRLRALSAIYFTQSPRYFPTSVVPFDIAASDPDGGVPPFITAALALK